MNIEYFSKTNAGTKRRNPADNEDSFVCLNDLNFYGERLENEELLSFGLRKFL